MEKLTQQDLIKIFNLSAVEANEICTKNPNILKTYKSVILENLQYLEYLGLTQDDLRKLILNGSHFIFYIKNNYIEHINYIKNTYNITNPQDWVNIFNNIGSCFRSESCKDFIFRLSTIKETANLTDETIKNLLINTVSLRHSDYEQDLITKIKLLNCFGLNINTLLDYGIINNSIPKMEQKLKLALLNNISLQDYVLRHYLTSDEKIYARMQAVKHGLLPAECVYTNESLIKAFSGFSSLELVKMYPINEEQINAEFTKKYPRINDAIKNIYSLPQQNKLENSLNSNYNKMFFFFNKMFNINENEFNKMVQFSPELLNANINDILNNIEQIKLRFNIFSDKTIKKIIINNPIIVITDISKINEIYNFLNDSYNLHPNHMITILINGHTFLKNDYTAMERYNQALKSICGFNDEDVKHLVLDTASTCLFDPYGINAKILLLNQFGVNIEDLKNKYDKKSYFALSQNYQNLEIELKLSHILGIDPATFLSEASYSSANRILRRYIYKNSYNKDFDIFISSDEIEQTYGINDYDLKKLFPNVGSARDIIDNTFAHKFPALNEQLKLIQTTYEQNPTSIPQQVSHNNETIIRKKCENQLKIYKTSSNPATSYKTFTKLSRYFNVTADDYEKLITQVPKIEQMDTGSLINNFAILTTLGLKTTEILSKPAILTTKPELLQVKAAMCYLSENKPSTFLTSLYKQNAAKTYARYKYLEGLKHKPTLIYETEQNFVAKTNIDSSTLAKMYPLNENSIKELLHKFSEETLKKEEECE